MPGRASLRGPVLLLAGLLAGGCTFTHRCTVPDPVVEAAPGARLPLAVKVQLLPGPIGSEVAQRNAPMHRWVVDAAPPTRALFERLAASAFEPDGATGALEIRIEALDLEFADPILGPYRASVGYRIVLRAPDGSAIGAWAVAGRAEQPLLWELSTHCSGIGRAFARAMQEAGAELLGRLAADPAVAAWLQAHGLPMPALALRDPGSYPATSTASPRPEGEPGAPQPVPGPPPAPVTPGTAMAARTFQIRTGLGLFTPEDTAGALEEGARGLVFALLGAEYRLAPWLGLEIEYTSTGRSYSGKTLPPGGPFAVPRSIFLSSGLVGAGLRAIAAGGPVEPWVGATAQLLRTELSGSYSLFGFTGSGWKETAWSAGLDLGAGLYLYPGGRWVICLDVRRLFARASFDLFPRSVSVGGWSGLVSLGGTLP